MKILIPVDPAKRKPLMYRPDGTTLNAVPVKISAKNSPEFNWFSVARWDDQQNEWHDSVIIKMLWSVKAKNYEITEWYDEVEFESLCPDDQQSETESKRINGTNFQKYLSHIEGQDYFKGFIIKNLKKCKNLLSTF